MNAPLVFDPDFTTPEDAPIFQASDDVCFRFPWEPLVAISSFFRNLQSLPLPPGDQDAVIPLPSATSKALKTIFLVADSLASGALLSVPSTYRSKHIPEVIAVADVYDLEAIFEPLFKAYFTRKSYYVALLLALILQDTAKADATAIKLLDKYQNEGHGDYGLPSWVDSFLSTTAPLAHSKLLTLFEFFDDKMDVGRFQDQVELKSRNEYPGFLPTCRTQQCPEYRSWASFRALASRKLTRAVVNLHNGNVKDMVEKATADIKCDDCAARMTELLRNALAYSRPHKPRDVVAQHQDLPWA